MKQNIILTQGRSAQSVCSSLVLSGMRQTAGMRIGGFSVQPAAHRLPQKGKSIQAVKPRFEKSIGTFAALHPLVSSLCFAVAAPLGIFAAVTMFTALLAFPFGLIFGWF